MTRSEGLQVTNQNLWMIAQEAAQDVTSKASPTAAVVFSAMALEAYVNNIFEHLNYYTDLNVQMPLRLRTLVAVGNELEERRAQLPEKVNIIGACLHGHGFDRSSRPYQDFDLLLALRHRLVHSRAARIKITNDPPHWSVIGEPKKIRQGLIERKLVDPKLVHFGWEVASRNSKLGEWAVQCAYAMAYALGECFPKSKWRRWAHTINPLTPESHRSRSRMKPLSSPSA